ncbi:hypothetical protein [Catenibacterium sp.]|uniref:hypothetical protein n=1 Tax=Catenibacterium sp. TaxID=2049022 RepID=UPI00399397BE
MIEWSRCDSRYVDATQQRFTAEILRKHTQKFSGAYRKTQVVAQCASLLISYLLVLMVIPPAGAQSVISAQPVGRWLNKDEHIIVELKVKSHGVKFSKNALITHY